MAVKMAVIASRWADTLTAEQRPDALSPAPRTSAAAETERITWFYTPTDHGGLALSSQQPAQQQLAMMLLDAALTETGYNVASTIIGLENILDRVEGFGVRWGRERGRDPGLFYLRLFGDPHSNTPWAWRFGGHHLSVNALIADGHVVANTPFFVGADPAAAPLPGGAQLRPLGDIETLARRFASTLDHSQRARMQLLDRAVSDIVSGNRAHLHDGDQMMHMQDLWRGHFRDPALIKAVDDIDHRAESGSRFTPGDHELMAYTSVPKGLSSQFLTDTQKNLLRAVVCAATACLPPLAGFDTDLDEMHIAWGGSVDGGDGPLYFRLQNTTLFYEYDNTQRDANHAHSVLRNTHRDFGIDVLGNHYAHTAH
ncbi:DUF3500 domain-containing protein [Mycolicibacterium sp. jd]|uniref:DUF3500 domain-containing protein n=1 Tax=unclassified Mycolicibacterium TaxID=2636767 RepID=UPI00351AF114